MKEIEDNSSNKLKGRRERLLTGALIGTVAFTGIGSAIFDSTLRHRGRSPAMENKHPSPTESLFRQSNRILHNRLQPTANEIGHKTVDAIAGENRNITLRADPYKKHGVVINIQSSTEGVIYQMKVSMLKEKNILRWATTYDVEVRQQYYEINYGSELKITKGGDPKTHDKNTWYGSIESSSDLAKGDTVNTHVFDPSALGVITMQADRVADESLKAATEALDLLSSAKSSI